MLYFSPNMYPFFYCTKKKMYPSPNMSSFSFWDPLSHGCNGFCVSFCTSCYKMCRQIDVSSPQSTYKTLAHLCALISFLTPRYFSALFSLWLDSTNGFHLKIYTEHYRKHVGFANSTTRLKICTIYSLNL